MITVAVLSSGSYVDWNLRGKIVSAEPLSVPHIFVIVMENQGYRTIVGNSSAPYLNSLIRTYGLAAGYFGVTHPSLPNYVAMLTGNFFGSYSDDESQRFGGRNLVDQLERHSLTWKAYMGGLPKPGYNLNAYPVVGPPVYRRKHDPFMLMTDVVQDKSRRQKVVPASQLSTDLKSGQVPNFSFIVPDVCHDMHGIGADTGDSTDSPCPYNPRNTLISAGDADLARLVPRILRSPTWTGNSTIFITWDEGDPQNSTGTCCDSPAGHGGGWIPTVVIARQGVRAYKSYTQYNHYSLLRTIQTLWHLPCLANTCDSTNVKPMVEFLHST